jgi:hypothetical protein
MIFQRSLRSGRGRGIWLRSVALPRRTSAAPPYWGLASARRCFVALPPPMPSPLPSLRLGFVGRRMPIQPIKLSKPFLTKRDKGRPCSKRLSSSTPPGRRTKEAGILDRPPSGGQSKIPAKPLYPASFFTYLGRVIFVVCLFFKIVFF